MYQRRRSRTTVLHDASVSGRVLGHVTEPGPTAHRVHTGQSVLAGRAARGGQQIVRWVNPRTERERARFNEKQKKKNNVFCIG